MLSFWAPMIPPTATAQEHKVTVVNGKPKFYDPPEVADAKDKLTAHIGKHAPPKPYTGAVQLVTKWCFPLTEGHFDGEYKATKPDTDNLQKLLKDVMTKLKFWTDDALVASEVVEKFYAERPGIYIAIKEL